MAFPQPHPGHLSLESTEVWSHQGGTRVAANPFVSTCFSFSREMLFWGNLEMNMGGSEVGGILGRGHAILFARQTRRTMALVGRLFRQFGWGAAQAFPVIILPRLSYRKERVQLNSSCVCQVSRWLGIARGAGGFLLSATAPCHAVIEQSEGSKLHPGLKGSY